MTTSLKTILKYTLFVSLVILAAIIFVPRAYPVQAFQERPGTQYWQFEDQSKIAYTFLNGDSSNQKPPIIYLHGGPGGQITNSQIDFFQEVSKLGYNIYLYDQIGSGHSTRLDDISQYTVKRHTKDLEKIVSAIDADEVILFGHSWGALLAIEYFAIHQEKVKKMILSGPGPIMPFDYTLSSQAAPDSLNLRPPKYSNRQGNQEASNIRSKAIYYWATIFKSKLASDNEADNFFTHLNQLLSRSTTCDGTNLPTYEGGSGYYAHIMTLKSIHEVPDKRNLIKGHPIPVLILKGQCDNQKWGFTNEYLTLFPNAELTIFQDAGHSIEPARYPEYISKIHSFLE